MFFLCSPLLISPAALALNAQGKLVGDQEVMELLLESLLAPELAIGVSQSALCLAVLLVLAATSPVRSHFIPLLFCCTPLPLLLPKQWVSRNSPHASDDVFVCVCVCVCFFCAPLCCSLHSAHSTPFAKLCSALFPDHFVALVS